MIWLGLAALAGPPPLEAVSLDEAKSANTASIASVFAED